MIYFAADLHLRERTWKGYPSIWGDQYTAFIKLCDAVADDPEGALVLAGDIFDTPYPSGLTEYVFQKALEKLKGRQLYFISGNHDNESVPRAKVLGMKQLSESPEGMTDILGVSVKGIDFLRDTEKLHSEIENANPADILVLHTGFRHLLGFNETWQVSEDDIPDKFEKVVAGHVHVHSEHGKVFSPGSLALHRSDEIDKGHGYFIVNPEDLSVSWEPVFTREYMKFKVGEDDEKDLEQLAERGGQMPPVVLMSYDNTMSGEADSIKDRYKGKVLFVSNVCVSETVQALETRADGEMDIQSVIDGYINENLDGSARDLAVSLMHSTAPDAELDSWLGERL